MQTENTDTIQSNDKHWQFKKGESGNPAGKPKGARHKATLAVQSLLDGEAENITRRAIELALEGDTTAMRLVLERIIPPRRENVLRVTLPELGGVQDLPVVMQGVVEAVACGEILPSEGQAMAGMLEQWRKAVETAELESRIARLEQKQKK